jgi:hypothetical protein
MVNLFRRLKAYINTVKAEKESRAYIVYFYDEYIMKWCMDDTMRTLPDAKRMVDEAEKDGINAFYLHKSKAITHCLQ